MFNKRNWGLYIYVYDLISQIYGYMDTRNPNRPLIDYYITQKTKWRRLGS